MIYKTKTFQSLIKRSQITDKDLISACRKMDKGLIGADLVGNLY
ncbi:type II toxin-antitoxin system RelE/ParE family toxin [Methylophaga pinxianii]|nr:type II toxin-antitoxin system RelE/ParE family toxin [Methylophaga pinxianii]